MIERVDKAAARGKNKQAIIARMERIKAIKYSLI